MIDPVSGQLLANQDILLEGDEILRLGEALSASGATRIDGRGLYAIPGLFDMHVHSLKLSPWLTHPLFVAAGVTSVRDMGGCIGIDEAAVACVDDKLQWREEVANGERVAPRYDAITSLAINGGQEIPAAGLPRLMHGL